MIKNSQTKNVFLILFMSLFCLLCFLNFLVIDKSFCFVNSKKNTVNNLKNNQNIQYSLAYKCSLIDPDKSLFLSQSQEDRHLMMFFNGLCNGTYVELGALDGLLFSNTHVFNKALQWKGLLIDASPSNHAKLQSNRPDEISVINSAICNTHKTVHYVEAGAVGGVWEFSTNEFREKWWGNEKKISDAQVVQCLPLRDIFLNYGFPFYADFFSLDVEGSELSVLESINFKNAVFGIILIEADIMNVTKNIAVRQLLISNGYIFLYWYQRSDWFMNENFSKIYYNHHVTDATNLFDYVSSHRLS